VDKCPQTKLLCSIEFRLAVGNDDILGKKLKPALFGGENSVFLNDIYSLKKVMKLAESLT
jgi:hypothetical protein